MPTETINLTAAGETTTPVRSHLALSTEIIPGTLGWGTAVVEMEYSIDYLNITGENTGGTWHTLAPRVRFGSGRPARYGIRIPSGSWVRLKVTTGGTGADPVADYVHLGAVTIPPEDRKILGQSRPANTTAVSLYSPEAGVRAEVEGITVCNTTGTDATFRLFLDTDGSTYDQTTSMYYDMVVEANTTFPIEPDVPWILDDPDGNIGIRTGTASALTFTVWGTEK